MGAALAVAGRRVIAFSCLRCGNLVTGDPERRPRGPNEKPYIDRRCKTCRWKRLEESPLR